MTDFHSFPLPGPGTARCQELSGSCQAQMSPSSQAGTLLPGGCLLSILPTRLTAPVQPAGWLPPLHPGGDRALSQGLLTLDKKPKSGHAGF